jgi:hypothetical protein
MTGSRRKNTAAAEAHVLPARRKGALKAQRLGESPVTLRLPVDLVVSSNLRRYLSER